MKWGGKKTGNFLRNIGIGSGEEKPKKKQKLNPRTIKQKEVEQLRARRRHQMKKNKDHIIDSPFNRKNWNKEDKKIVIKKEDKTPPEKIDTSDTPYTC